MPALALNPNAAGCWCCVAVHGAGAGAASWLCKWKQVAGSGAGAGCRVPLLVPGAGAVSWLCTWWRQGACRCCVPGACCELAAHVVETWCRHWVGAGWRCWCWCCELAVCTQRHTVLSLERSLSICAVGYLPSSGSVLADSCVKGCTVCVRTFVRIMLYAQRQAHVSACFTHTIVVLDVAWPWASKAYGLCRLCAYFCARKLVHARSYWPYRSTDRCFKHATKSTVALDTAWPWANDTYGLCCLCAYFCAHNLFRARSYVVIPCCARGGDRVPVLGTVAGCWVCVVDCELAVRVVPTGCGCWVLSAGCACGGNRVPGAGCARVVL